MEKKLAEKDTRDRELDDKASYSIIRGDCMKKLKDIPESFFQCCVTSPPYWGMRDYGVDGQIGKEAFVDTYISNIVNVFRHVRRVLRDDGTLWLNIGDTYTSGNRKTRAPDKKNRAREMSYRPATPKGLKPYEMFWFMLFFETLLIHQFYDWVVSIPYVRQCY